MAVFVYYAEFARFEDCENWIASAIDRNGHACIRLQRNRSGFDVSRLIDIIKVSDAQFLLLSKTPEVSAEQLMAIRAATGVKIVFWTFDWMRHPANWAWYGPLAKVADACFQTDGHTGGPGDSSMIADAAEIDRFELHQGIDPYFHRRIVPTPAEQEMYGAKLAFAGSTYTKRRAELVRHLERYSHFKKWGEPELPLWGRRFQAMCASTDIVIGDNFTNEVPGYWSDRCYLTLGCGGFFLTAYVEGLEKEFEDGVHLAWWQNFAEMHEKIGYYGARPDLRAQISSNGWDLVRKRDTYDQRIRKMTECLKLASAV